MTVVLINPNSTASMTVGALDAARTAAPGMQIDGWTSHLGPASIQGPADGAAAVPPLLNLVRKADAAGASGIIIACFDDTGLPEARKIARCPVIGIGQASFALATLLADRFSVVTTVPEAVPVIEANIREGGFGHGLIRVIAADVPVLELDDSHHLIADAAHTALSEGPGALVLGCAGMVTVIEHIRRTSPVPVLDGVTAAARLMAVALETTRVSEPA